MLVTLGVETVADLANIWTSATEIFDSFSEPRLVESLSLAYSSCSRRYPFGAFAAFTTASPSSVKTSGDRGRQA